MQNEGNPLAADLDGILAETEKSWAELRGGRVFVSGGTGFFGCWLLESFAWANRRLGLGASAIILTRAPARFRARAPHLAADPSIQLWPGDVRTFEPPAGAFSHLIHAATPTDGDLEQSDPLALFDVIVGGTRRVLDFARSQGTPKVLLTSSGAVYGRQPPSINRLREDEPLAPPCDDPSSAYGEGKRSAELLGSLYAARHRVPAKIARCFAFVGPYQPLDRHFAVGSFIRDKLAGGPIRVRGDGAPFRSYLYAADLACWLWRILFDGAPARAYNVGSDEPIAIAELARLVAASGEPRVPVVVEQAPEPRRPPHRYVPSTERARTELGLRQTVEPGEAIRRTIAWHRNSPYRGG